MCLGQVRGSHGGEMGWLKKEVVNAGVGRNLGCEEEWGEGEQLSVSQ